MATRSPTQTHSYWGSYATGSLPTSSNVQVGDTAFDTTLVALVVCTLTSPVTWAAVGAGGGGITGLTQDVLAGPGSGSQVATVQGMGGATTKTHLVIEGGKFATLQAAVTAAAANDVIMVGPKATGDWGNVLLNVTDKPLIIAAMSGAGSNKIVKIGSVTYDLGTTGPVLNANLNETYLYGLYIQGAFAGGSAVTLTGGANYPGRLRLYGCYVLNTSATGAAAVTNSNAAVDINGRPTSSIYLDSCVVSLTPSAAGSTIVQTAGYTLIRNRSDVSGSSAVGATGSAIKVSAGTVEILDSSISIDRAGNTSSTIDIPAGSSAATFVSAGYSTISNNSNAATSACVNIGTAGATFGAGDATLASGASVAAAGFAVKGIAGGSFLYANVSFSWRTAVSTVTATATAQSGGLFSYGMSVGASALVVPTFVVNASGNITKLNNITTSFPSAQGTAGQVLANDGAGTLSWATRVTSVTATSPITSSGGTTPVIALGTVTVAKGGTNLTATPTNGQLLIGNGTGYTLATLTAGTGISITNGAGAITIAATAVAAPITVSLDGTSAATVATYVGAVYIPNAITLGAASQAFLGTAGAGETVTLDLMSGATVIATFSASITGFQAVLVTGTPLLAAGWYDLVLTAGATSTAFARGLYLV